MKKALLLFVLACGCADPAPAPTAEITVEASFGGRPPWSDNGTLKIDATGRGHFTRYRPDGGKTLHEQEFSLDPTARAAILRAVKENGFFGLKGMHDSGAADGSYCSIEIVAECRAHRVTCVNFPLPAFDNVALAINAVVPESCRIFYNPIVR